MKIIHCADIHLGSKMETNLSKEKAKIRKEEIFDAFNKMIEYASSNNIKHIIISGDLIDSKNVSSTVKNKVLKIFNKYSDINFYYLEVNHDAHVLDLTDIPSNLFVFNIFVSLKHAQIPFNYFTVFHFDSIKSWGVFSLLQRNHGTA